MTAAVSAGSAGSATATGQSPPAFTHGLTPSESAFLAEHELVDVIPRQRLDSMQLLGGKTPALVPPRRTAVPLWLALLLKRQQRANISAPPWLSVDSLMRILQLETELGTSRGFTRSPQIPTTSSLEPAVSGAFIPGSSSSSGGGGALATSAAAITTASRSGANSLFVSQNSTADENDIDAGEDPLTRGTPGQVLPYYWLEIAHLLLSSAADDIPDADGVRRLVRDLRETRAAKIREGVLPTLDGGCAAKVSGIGALEVAEHRAFITGVVDGLRRIGASKEAGRREAEEERRGADADDDDTDDDMGI